MDKHLWFKQCACLMMMFTVFNNFICNTASSQIYTVGDEQEWSSSTNYVSWSKKYNFKKGDVLAFKYVKGQHNVYEVTEKTYRSCDSSTGVLDRYESGEDLVKLSEAKTYWFICNLPGHCLGGMRFSIEVKENGGTQNTGIPTSNPSFQQNQPASPNNASKGNILTTWNSILCLVLFHILLTMTLL